MRSGGGRRELRFALASAILTVAAVDVVTLGMSSTAPPAPAAVSSVLPISVVARALGRVAPASVSIPTIDVDADGLVPLGRQSDGSLQVPNRYGQPGWYRLGPAPGQPGAAVIVGHVDSQSGPAVFWRLGQLRPGDVIGIGRRDGTVLRFTVYAVRRYPKDDFPTTRVYGGTRHRAELRLITCGGTFDHSTGHYQDNTVVFATLAEPAAGSEHSTARRSASTVSGSR